MRMLAPRIWLWLTIALVTLGCAPATGRSGGETAGSQAPATAPKRLRVGILQEPKGWAPWSSTSSSGGAQQTIFLVTRTLTVIADDGSVKPALAEAGPSVQQGSWRIEPDGTMEQTWRIRPNARWQDGRPLTADDFLFAWEILSHLLIPNDLPDARNLISGVASPDPRTLILRFKGTTPLAEQMLFDPYPRHILGDLLASGETDRLINHEYWTTSFIGAGPYRVVEWQPGAFIEFAAFSDYVEGRPKIDTITVRFLTDPNTLMANIIGGKVDVALPDGISVDMAQELQRGWAGPGTGNTTILALDGRMFRLYFQHRADQAKPAAARDPRVRRALYHTIDKDGINEVELAGLGRNADSYIAPDDPRLPEFRDAIPAWSRDITQARRILDDGGWQPGSDGVLVHAATGERLETEIRVTPGQGHVKAVAVFADGWRQAGAAVTETVMPQNRVGDGEYRSTQGFAALHGHRIGLRWENQHYSCGRAARPENRWTGSYGGYCSAEADPLIAKLQVTVAEAERTALQVQIMRTVLKDDAAELPLYWQVTPYVFAAGVTGIGKLNPGPFGNAWSAWNAHLWDKL